MSRIPVDGIGKTHSMRSLFEACRTIPASVAAQHAGLLLKQSGKNLKANCPWHQDKTPSLNFFPDGRYYCFSCHKGGDAVGFYAAYYNLSPLKAAQKLAGDFGLSEPSSQYESNVQKALLPKQYDAHDLMWALEVYRQKERVRLDTNIRLAQQALAIAEELLDDPDVCWNSDQFCWLLKNLEQQKMYRDFLETATMEELFHGAMGGDTD